MLSSGWSKCACIIWAAECMSIGCHLWLRMPTHLQEPSFKFRLNCWSEETQGGCIGVGAHISSSKQHIQCIRGACVTLGKKSSLRGNLSCSRTNPRILLMTICTYSKNSHRKRTLRFLRHKYSQKLEKRMLLLLIASQKPRTDIASLWKAIRRCRVEYDI